MRERSDYMVELFKIRFEQQAGKVYEVKELEEACSFASQVLERNNVSRVVLAQMPDGYGKKLRKALAEKGIEVLDLEGLRGEEVARAINSADAGITLAEFAIADVAAIVEVTEDDRDRLVSSLPRIHVSLLRRNKIVERFEESAELMRRILQKRDRCVISLIAGPSRTGDIELKLVLGVHGPHQVHVILFG